MTDQLERQDIEERLEQIEKMLSEGRSSIQRGGWGLVLWGSAYLIATAWGMLTREWSLAWATTMIAAACITTVIARAKAKGVRSFANRALCAIWGSIGGALWVFCGAVSATRHWELHSFIAAICALVGAGYLATGIFLRWHAQALLGILWWAAAVASCLVAGPQQIGWIFAVMDVAMIGFGIYLMILESRASRAMRRVAHA